MKARLSLLLASIILSVMTPPALAGEPPVLPAYFPPNSDGLAPLIVLRGAPPPRNAAQTNATYGYGPLTGVWSGNAQAVSRSTWVSDLPGELGWENVWVNRVQSTQFGFPHPNPPNPLPHFAPVIPRVGHEANGVEFTTLARADAATAGNVAFILGLPLGAYRSRLTAAGLTIVPWAAAVANPGKYFTHNAQDGSAKLVAYDTFFVPPSPGSGQPDIEANLYAVTLDWEPHDNRTPAQAQQTLDSLSVEIHAHGRKAFLFTNPWDGPLMPANGFAITIMNDITAKWDYVSNLVVHGGASDSFGAEYDFGMTYLSGVSGLLDPKKVIVVFDLDGAGKPAACAIYSRHVRDGFAGYLIISSRSVIGNNVPPAPWTPGSSNTLLEELLWGKTSDTTNCP